MTPATGHPVIELRQYKIVRGQRDAMIALFEREFVDSQEALGMRLIGQFRDRDDPGRFTWIREFPGMAARAAALNAFYTGPVWQAHRAEANAKLEDNDNVLLLRAAAPDIGFRPIDRDETAPPGPIFATIHYLWKDPAEGFAAFFLEAVQPVLARSGLPVIAALVREEAPNNFPRLPIREGEKVFVWFTRAPDAAAFDQAMAALRSGPLGARLTDVEERAVQVLALQPTPCSRLR